jgi:hypothetical protein
MLVPFAGVVAGHTKVAADALEDSCDGLAATDPNFGGCIGARVADYLFSRAGARDAPSSRPGRRCAVGWPLATGTLIPVRMTDAAELVAIGVLEATCAFPGRRP